MLILGCGSSPSPSDVEVTDTAEVSQGRLPYHGQGLHEQQLERGEVPYAHVQDHLILHLESTQTHEHDTGEVGQDLVPLMFHEDTTHTFCMDEDKDSGHYARLLGPDKTVLAEIPAGSCEKVQVTAGLHELQVYFGDKPTGLTHKTMFIRPMNTLSAQDLEQASAPLETGADDGGQCEASCDGAIFTSVDDLGRGQAAVVDACPGVGGVTGVSRCFSPPGTGALVLGPLTRAVLFSKALQQGTVSLISNDSPNAVQCFPASQHPWGSFIASSSAKAEAGFCKPARQATFCHGQGGCNGNIPSSDQINLAADEVMLVGPIHSDQSHVSSGNTCCTLGWVFSHSNPPCRDLASIGFDNGTYNLLVGSNAVVHLFQDTDFSGPETILSNQSNQGTQTYPGCPYPVYSLPAAGSSRAGPGTISSLRLETTETDNASTLISSRHCNNCNLSGVDLSNQDLSGSELQGAILTNANLTSTQLANSDLTSAVLSGANCTYTNFKSCTLNFANLAGNGNNLQAANLSHAVLDDAVLDGANLRGVSFEHAQFADTGSDRSSARNAQMVGANFSGAILKGVNLDSADLTGVNFTSAILLNCKLTGIAMDTSSSCDYPTRLTSAVLYGSEFNQSRLTCTDLTNAMISFQPGSYPLSHIFSWNNGQYDKKTSSYAFKATYPDFMPLDTQSSTTCPDGRPGPCNSNGGESCESCPVDCDDYADSCPAALCSDNWQCNSLAWPGGQAGRFCCKANHTCEAHGDDLFCGDGVCDFLGGETPASCPGDCICGDGTCSWADSENTASCPADCPPSGGSSGTPIECSHGSECVSRPWPGTVGLGHWDCINSQCAATEDTSSDGPHCGDGICDNNGRWMPLTPPDAYLSNGGWSPLEGPCGTL